MPGKSRAGWPSVRAVKRDHGEDDALAAVAAQLARVAAAGAQSTIRRGQPGQRSAPLVGR